MLLLFAKIHEIRSESLSRNASYNDRSFHSCHASFRNGNRPSRLRYSDYSVARFFLYSSNPLSRQLPRFAISLSLSPRFKIPRCLINDYCLSFAFQTAPPPLQNPDEYFNATLPLFPSKLHFHSHRGYNGGNDEIFQDMGITSVTRISSFFSPSPPLFLCCRI